MLSCQNICDHDLFSMRLADDKILAHGVLLFVMRVQGESGPAKDSGAAGRQRRDSTVLLALAAGGS
jgi:hypothetical protein